MGGLGIDLPMLIDECVATLKISMYNGHIQCMMYLCSLSDLALDMFLAHCPRILLKWTTEHQHYISSHPMHYVKCNLVTY